MDEGVGRTLSKSTVKMVMEMVEVTREIPVEFYSFFIEKINCKKYFKNKMMVDRSSVFVSKILIYL